MKRDLSVRIFFAGQQSIKVDYIIKMRQTIERKQNKKDDRYDFIH